MKNLILSITAILLLSYSSLFAQSDGMGLGGNVGFRRNFLRIQGELIKNLGSAQPGLNYLVGANTVKDSLGNVIESATWGWNFSSDLLQDEQVLITGMTMEAWADKWAVRWIGGLRFDFLVPTDEGSFLTKDTNNLGGCLRARFDAQGLPVEVGGAFTRSYSGISKLDVSSIYMGLIFTE